MAQCIWEGRERCEDGGEGMEKKLEDMAQTANLQIIPTNWPKS